MTGLVRTYLLWKSEYICCVSLTKKLTSGQRNTPFLTPSIIYKPIAYVTNRLHGTRFYLAISQSQFKALFRCK